MFMGQYRYSLDNKGRIVIPLDFRRQMGTSIVVNKGFEKCIIVYTVDTWEEFVGTIGSLNDFSEKNRQYKRLVMSSAFSKEIDYQGRVMLDKSLIEHAKITKDVIIIGSDKVIEIWDPVIWQEVEKNREEELVNFGNEIAEQMKKNG